MCDITGCGPDTPIASELQVSDDDRRLFLKGLIALPFASILADAALSRAYAATAGVTDVSFTHDGTPVSGVLAMPETTPAPVVVLIHEWWGLNDHIKAVAAEYAKAGFIAFAVDLYGGQVATTRDGAMGLRQALDPVKATAELKGAVDYFRAHSDATGKVGTVGWCFGGGWSLNTGLAADVDATVIYYGNVRKSAAELATLKAPVLGHFGTEDKFINPAMVGDFMSALDEAGKADLVKVHWYTANHAFANPTGGRYDKDDAELSWGRTLTFFHRHLS